MDAYKKVFRAWYSKDEDLLLGRKGVKMEGSCEIEMSLAAFMAFETMAEYMFPDLLLFMI